MVRVPKLAGNEDLLPRNAGGDDSFSDFCFVAVHCSCVDVSVPGLQCCSYSFSHFTRRGLLQSPFPCQYIQSSWQWFVFEMRRMVLTYPCAQPDHWNVITSIKSECLARSHICGKWRWSYSAYSCNWLSAAGLARSLWRLVCIKVRKLCSCRPD